MKVDLKNMEEVAGAKQEFDRNAKFRPIFEEMVDTGKILVVEEEDIKELEKFQRNILEMSKRFIPDDLKLETRRRDTVLIARLTEKKNRPASLGQLMNRCRHKTVSELEQIGAFHENAEPSIQHYLAQAMQ